MKKKTAFYKGLTALVISSMLVTVPAVSHLAYADSDVKTEATTEPETTEAEPETTKAEPTTEAATEPETTKVEPTTEAATEPETTEAEPTTEATTEPETTEAEPTTEAATEPETTKAEPTTEAATEPETKAETVVVSEATNDLKQTKKDAAAEFEANIAKLKAYEEKLESLTSEDAAAVQELLDAVSAYLDANEDKLTSEIEAFLNTFTKKFAEASIKLVAEATKSINDQIKGGDEKSKTIEVTADTKEDVVIPDGYSITLKIADGVTLTNVKGHTITVQKGGTLVIEGEGTIDNITHGKAAIYNNGALTINGGTFERSKEAGTYNPYSNGGNSYYTVYNGYNASLTINDGIFENNGGYSSMLRNLGKLEINDGVFESGVNTIKNDDTGEALIAGGDFSNITQAVILNWHNLTITGGTFTAGSEDEYVAMNSSWYESNYKQINKTDYYSNGTLIIEDGEFIGKIGEYVFSAENEANNKGEKNIIVRGGDLTNVPSIEAGERTTLEISDEATLSDEVVIKVSNGATRLKLPTNVAKEKDTNYSYTFIGWFDGDGNAYDESAEIKADKVYTPYYLVTEIESRLDSADVEDAVNTAKEKVSSTATDIITKGAEENKDKIELAEGIEDLDKEIKDALRAGSTITTKLELDSIDQETVEQKIKDAFNEAVEKANASDDTASAAAEDWAIDPSSFVDINVNMYIGKGASEKNVARITQLNDEIELSIDIPEALQAKNANYAVLRYHGDAADVLEVTKSTDGKKVTFKTDKFSQYVLMYQEIKTADNTDDKKDDSNNNNNNNNNNSSTARSSSGNRSSETTASTAANNGSWMQDATGWWFKKADGSYPKDTWYECVWNGVSNWYHFNAQGYADGGWLTDKDGQKYYLHNAHDGKFGFMYTGWNQIANQWYYFNTSSIATGLGSGSHSKGSLVTNATTADGYQVGADGAWIK